MAIITTGLLLVLATWLVELVVLRIVLQKEMSRRQNFDLFLINLLSIGRIEFHSGRIARCSAGKLAADDSISGVLQKRIVSQHPG
jgi:hypothetical protein